jgi:hypothetical protein
MTGHSTEQNNVLPRLSLVRFPFKRLPLALSSVCHVCMATGSARGIINMCDGWVLRTLKTQKSNPRELDLKNVKRAENQ